MAFHVYILSCNANTAIYIGATDDLMRRVAQHRSGAGGVHTSKYRIRKLVYFEAYAEREDALRRERQLKRWRRDWKDALIAKDNPYWRDLAFEVQLQ